MNRVTKTDYKDAYQIAKWYGHKQNNKRGKISTKTYNLTARVGKDVASTLIRTYIRRINSSDTESNYVGSTFLHEGVHHTLSSEIEKYHKRLVRDLVNDKFHAYLEQVLKPESYILGALMPCDKTRAEEHLGIKIPQPKMNDDEKDIFYKLLRGYGNDEDEVNINLVSDEEEEEDEDADEINIFDDEEEEEEDEIPELCVMEMTGGDKIYARPLFRDEEEEEEEEDEEKEEKSSRRRRKRRSSRLQNGKRSRLADPYPVYNKKVIFLEKEKDNYYEFLSRKKAKIAYPSFSELEEDSFVVDDDEEIEFY